MGCVTCLPRWGEGVAPSSPQAKRLTLIHKIKEIVVHGGAHRKHHQIRSRNVGDFNVISRRFSQNLLKTEKVSNPSIPPHSTSPPSPPPPPPQHMTGYAAGLSCSDFNRSKKKVLCSTRSISQHTSRHFLLSINYVFTVNE